MRHGTVRASRSAAPRTRASHAEGVGVGPAMVAGRDLGAADLAGWFAARGAPRVVVREA
jgi:hypothetical protein